MSKVIVSRDVVFRESQMYMEEEEKSATKTNDSEIITEHVELVVPEGPVYQRSETDENDQEQEETMPIEQATSSNYQLARHRHRRQIKTPARYAQANTMSFALSIAKSLECDDPQSFREAVT